jgi:ribulose-5-phosphate 4-epimerase/fuculose-1-phosphate aldolase
MSVTPIRPVRGDVQDDAEQKLRVELAAAFRTAYDYGWNREIFNHITARTPDGAHFLMNPLGLGWNEITAANLAKIHLETGERQPREVALAPAGYNFHGGILRARPDVNCVLHVHAPASVVISSLEDGLMILDQAGCMLHEEFAYHGFEGFVTEAEEVPRMLEDIGTRRALIMYNHGLLTIGSSVAEAFVWMRRLVAACELQERVMATGGRIHPVSREAIETTRNEFLRREKNRPSGGAEWAYHLRQALQNHPDLEG